MRPVALPAGSRVRVAVIPPEAHTRTPYYLRGKVGTIIGEIGIYRDPSRLAYHKPGLPMRRLYRVRFQQRDIWAGYPQANDTLFADLYESWLEPAESGDARKDA